MELLRFLNEHENWEDLLESAPYNLKISKDGEYILFKYNQLESDFNEQIVREARGSIFTQENEKWKCVCHPFDKFFNYGEPYASEIDWDSAFVLEKIDGSLMKIWYHNGWHLSTNGTIDAFKALVDGEMSYGGLFEKAIGEPFAQFAEEKKLFKDVTTMFELATELNRMVVPHKGFNIYYLGERYNKSGIEYYYIRSDCRIKYPKVYSANCLEQVVKMADELPWDEEGYVVKDRYTRRIKVKSPEYIKAHYARGNNLITSAILYKVIMKNEVDEFLVYADDYKDYIDEKKEVIKTFCDLVNKKKLAYSSYETHKGLYASVIKDEPVLVKACLFRMFGTDITPQDFLMNCFERYGEKNFAEKMSVFELDNIEKVLEGLIKDTAIAPDIEEAQEL